MSFKAVLQKLKVTDIDAPKEIVTVESSESFETAFSKLVKVRCESSSFCLFFFFFLAFSFL